MKNCERAVYFSHGQESGPWGTKLRRLAEVAAAQGFAVESIDYRGMMDPDERVEKLIASVQKHECLILVGSSMGGYVATIASEMLKPQGLFLLAPAFYRPGYARQDPTPCAETTTIIHGWNDEQIPVDNSIRFAREHRALLHLVDGDHRLKSQLPFLAAQFALFLECIRRGEYPPLPEDTGTEDITGSLPNT